VLVLGRLDRAAQLVRRLEECSPVRTVTCVWSSRHDRTVPAAVQRSLKDEVSGLESGQSSSRTGRTYEDWFPGRLLDFRVSAFRRFWTTGMKAGVV
jgi:hypothetical protein